MGLGRVSLRTWLLVAAVVALLAWILGFVPDAQGARDALLAIVSVVVLALPGFALASLLRTRTEVTPLPLTLAGSALGLGMVAIGGLLLNLLPFGLNRWSWLVLTGVLLLGIWALEPERRKISLRLPSVAARPGDLLLVGAALVLVMMAVVVARIGATETSEAFSQLWVTRSTTANVAARVVLQNDEGVTTTYQVILAVGGRPVTSWSPVTLVNGQRWSADLADEVPAGEDLKVIVFRATDPTVPYRWVVLHGPVSAPLAVSGQAQ